MDSATKLEERHVENGFAEDDKNTVHWLGEFGDFVAQSFVNAATDAVAADGGFEDLFGDDDSKALITAVVGVKDKRKRGSADGLSLLISVADATAGVETVSFS